MQKEMKPCPNCGHSSDWQFFSGDIMRRQCRCVNCGMTGPDAETLENAIAAWNSLPRHLNWTIVTPTKPDFYWNKSGNLLRIGEILEISGSLWCHFAGEKEPQLLELVGGEWAGPIQEPED